LSGIAGIWDRREARPHDALVGDIAGMAEAMRLRGPDSGSFWNDSGAGIALAHRLLSVADRVAPENQPLVSSCGRYVLTCEGEVYNADELVAELRSAGRALINASDPSLIIEAIAAWGLEAALRRLNAMFAGALWDRERRELHLFRDRFGERPLYWTEAGGTFLFASATKAFRACAEFVPVLDRDVVAAFLRRHAVPGPFSIYRGVRMLEPGSILSIDSLSGPQIRPYWSLDNVARRGLANQFAGSDAEAADRVDVLLRDAVARRTNGKPVGVFLSGGVDSSMLLAQLQAVMPGRAHSIAIGFHEPGFDEAGPARAVARYIGAIHDEQYVSASHARDLIPQLPEIYDEPMADVAQIPIFFASKLARGRVCAVFGGDGGDEFFGGYEQHLDPADLLRYLHRLPPLARRPAEALIRAAPPFLWAHLSKALPTTMRPTRLTDKLALLARLFAGDAEDAYRMMGSYWHNPDALVIGGREPPALRKDLRIRTFIPDDAERIKYLITMTTTTDSGVLKFERAAGAVGLENRTPLLDHRLADLSWTLPPSMKLRGRTSKWLLRQVLHRYVPPALTDRAKMGFDVPIGLWLRGPLRDWAEALLDEKRLSAEGILRPGPIRARWQEHLMERRNWGGPLWNVLMFQAWKERWLP
jgi:asparagine synthase (glutamine-hydrolysing)